jgi:hypothetical protein
VPYLWAWGFKSPLRHQMARANALAIVVFTSERSSPNDALSAVCQQAGSERLSTMCDAHTCSRGQSGGKCRQPREYAARRQQVPVA